jgi:molybdopterin converting factor small subunit
MSINVHLHKTLQSLTNNLEIIETEGKTIGECLDHLIRRFPALEEKLFAKKGTLHNFVEIYLNLETAYPDELAKAVKDGDDIHVTLMLAGG